MQILPGLYLINGHAYGRHQNGYLLRGRGAAIVIDSGDLEDDSFPTVEAGLRRWGLAPSEVTHLLVTHAHFDHSSHAARFRRLGAKIVASADTAEAMAAGDDRCIGYAVGQRFEPCETDLVVHDGETVDLGGVAIRCIAAPGHAEGLMVFETIINGERLWFPGDLLKVGLECEDVQLGWAGGPDYDRATYLETLRKLAHMECDTLLPGHGHPGLGLGKRLIEMAYTKAMLEWR